jgi:superfamily II DNA helicase RecQ
MPGFHSGLFLISFFKTPIVQRVAPCLIFHDKTLKAIAGSKPETPAALLEIPGIGEMKAERYGRRVLAVVNGAH